MFVRQNHNLSKLIDEIIDYSFTDNNTNDTLSGYNKAAGEFLKERPVVNNKVPIVIDKEEESMLTLSVELPGVNKKDVAVTSVKGMVFVNAESMRTGKVFNREARLDSKWNLSEIDATMVNGLLTLTIPAVVVDEPSVTTIKIK
tara:strand:+ start:2126 stop:2557 length:432 start_codon:yes stop_codon:yes gene_type:complete